MFELRRKYHSKMKNFAKKLTSSVAMFSAGAVVATIACSYVASVNAKPTRIAQGSGQDSKVVSVDQERELKTELKGCKRSGQKVLCNFLLTNLGNQNRRIEFVGNNSRIIDDSGAEYIAVSVQVGAYVHPSSQQTDLIPNIPTKVVLTFEIPPQVSNFSVVETVVKNYVFENNMRVNSQFRNVNLGTSQARANTNCDNSTPSSAIRRKK